MDVALEKLKKLVNKIYPLPEEDWLYLSDIWKPIAYKRKEIITSAGEIEKSLYFVVEGVQRVYYLDELNREATIIFTYPPSFGGVLDSMMLKKPSAYFFETLTPSKFLKANYIDLENLMLQSPAISLYDKTRTYKHTFGSIRAIG